VLKRASICVASSGAAVEGLHLLRVFIVVQAHGVITRIEHLHLHTATRGWRRLPLTQGTLARFGVAVGTRSLDNAAMAITGALTVTAGNETSPRTRSKLELTRRAAIQHGPPENQRAYQRADSDDALGWPRTTPKSYCSREHRRGANHRRTAESLAWGRFVGAPPSEPRNHTRGYSLPRPRRGKDGCTPSGRGAFVGPTTPLAARRGAFAWQQRRRAAALASAGMQPAAS
jgi:hypothetical protein